MPIVLYPRQRQILEYISQYIQRYGMAPTLTDLAKTLKVSTVTMYEHLEKLEQKGVLRRVPGKGRSLEVVEENIPKGVSEGVQLPIMGFIAAGSPIEPYSQNDVYLPVSPALLTSTKPHYVLQVKGDSLIDEGIFDGDYVVIEHRQDAQDGDLVVALLESGLATLKKIFFEKDRVKLAPANAKHNPIYSTSVTIQGRAVAVIRKY